MPSRTCFPLSILVATVCHMNNLQAKVVLSVGFASDGNRRAMDALWRRKQGYSCAPLRLHRCCLTVQALQPDKLDFTSKETRAAVLDMVLLHTCPQSQLLFNRIRRRLSLPLLGASRRVEWETAILLVVCALMKKMVTHWGGGRKVGGRLL